MKDARRTVMIVEDDRDVRETIAEILQDNDYVAVGAANGAEALAELRGSTEVDRPGLILLDMMMPIMDGWELREALTADESLRDIPVVVLTAHASAPDVAARLNAAGYLRKPVSLRTLLDTVARFCGEAARS
jgi:CheY-like chemotaxis protein